MFIGGTIAFGVGPVQGVPKIPGLLLTPGAGGPILCPSARASAGHLNPLPHPEAMKQLTTSDAWDMIRHSELVSLYDDMGSAGDLLGIATLRVAWGDTLDDIAEEMSDRLTLPEWQEIATMSRQEAQRVLLCECDWLRSLARQRGA